MSDCPAPPRKGRQVQQPTEQHRSAPWSRVTAITVTYSSASVVGGCLESIAQARHVIVVDNASVDHTVETVTAAAPRAEVIESPRNLGFGRGNNLALERTETEYALLINPDARLRQGALEALVETADRFPDAAIIGPALINADGSRRLSHDVPYIRRRDYPRKRHMEPPPEGPFCTWALSGAVMLLRMSSLREIGFFDPNIFLFFEDNDLCLRATKAGYTLIQEPRALADHAEGGSSSPSLRRTWNTSRSYSRSRIYLIAKHWGKREARRAIMSLAPIYLIRALTCFVTFRWQKALINSAQIAGMLQMRA
jgi:N-acetylglucosaminyl-diphospho-decaprenol L-rhamnosyltransferase